MLTEYSLSNQIEVQNGQLHARQYKDIGTVGLFEVFVQTWKEP